MRGGEARVLHTSSPAGLQGPGHPGPPATCLAERVAEQDPEHQRPRSWVSAPTCDRGCTSLSPAILTYTAGTSAGPSRGHEAQTGGCEAGESSHQDLLGLPSLPLLNQVSEQAGTRPQKPPALRQGEGSPLT